MVLPDGKPSREDDARRARELYEAGKPLFTRAVLEDLDRRIERGEKKVVIKDYLDREHSYALEIPSWCADQAYVLTTLSKTKTNK